MVRTKLFISYSHHDRPWLERLTTHLAFLERRRGLLHVWSDTRVGAGGRWQEEIEDALSAAGVAVLLISPAFLASDFIWTVEMPKILEHKEAGMLVWPLIVRPCAWRIAPQLAQLQARPAGGRALSLGSDAEVDSDLAEFVYELAGRVEQLSGPNSGGEGERLRGQSTAAPRTGAAHRTAPGRGTESAAARGGALVRPGQTWRGSYRPTARRLKLDICGQSPQEFSGTLMYEGDGSVTTVKGQYLDPRVVQADEMLTEARGQVSDIGCGISFRETDLVKTGIQPPDRNGEYRAIVSGELMLGIWQLGGRPVGDFELRLEVKSPGE